jgi:hypothetical protein
LLWQAGLFFGDPCCRRLFLRGQSRYHLRIPHPLRFAGENDDDFRTRAERAGEVAKLLVAACLNNTCMQRYLADPTTLHTVDSVLRSPTVHIEYEQAIAIGGLGECLAATKSKKWGAGSIQTGSRMSSGRIASITVDSFNDDE